MLRSALLAVTVALICSASFPEESLLTIEFPHHPPVTAIVNGSCREAINAALSEPPRFPRDDIPERPTRAYCEIRHNLFPPCSYYIKGSADAHAAGCP